jgi:hypothetical protein
MAETNLSKLSKEQLFKKCEDLGITKYKSKNKIELIKLIEDNVYTLIPIKNSIEFIIKDEQLEQDVVEELLIKGLVENNKNMYELSKVIKINPN